MKNFYLQKVLKIGSPQELLGYPNFSIFEKLSNLLIYLVNYLKMCYIYTQILTDK